MLFHHAMANPLSVTRVRIVSSFGGPVPQGVLTPSTWDLPHRGVPEPPVLPARGGGAGSPAWGSQDNPTAGASPPDPVWEPALPSELRKRREDLVSRRDRSGSVCPLRNPESQRKYWRQRVCHCSERRELFSVRSHALSDSETSQGGESSEGGHPSL